MPKPIPILEPLSVLKKKFNEKVIRSRGCWSWSGEIAASGYSILNINGKRLRAHRVSYLIHRGTFPTELDIIHLCHNPECTNPAHLEAGSRKRNMASSHIIGRLQRKLPMSDFKRIEQRRAAGESLAQIAESYGCSKQSVKNLIEQHNLDDKNGRKKDADTLITYNGETLPLRTWAIRVGIDRHTLRHRYVRQGWSAERSLTTPIMRGNPKTRKPLKP